MALLVIATAPTAMARQTTKTTKTAKSAKSAKGTKTKKSTKRSQASHSSKKSKGSKKSRTSKKKNVPEKPILGVDVSRFNGEVDFEQVVAQGYSFVFIKASEGVGERDAMFKAHHSRAAKAGMKVGAYHYFRKNREGRDQADNFLAAVAGLNLDLPLVIDLEDWGNDNNVKNEVVIKRVREMVEELRKRKRQVMIYTNGDGFKNYYAKNFEDVPLWLCSFKGAEEIAHCGHVMVQLSHNGQLDGTRHPIDLNRFCGTQRQWRRFLSTGKIK